MAMKRFWWIFLLILLVLMGMAMWAWLAAPRLLETSPAPNSKEVPRQSSLRRERSPQERETLWYRFLRILFPFELQ